MKRQPAPVHPVDEHMRQAAQRLPVDDPGADWKALRQQLDLGSAPGTPATDASAGTGAQSDRHPAPGPSGWWWRGLGLLSLGALIFLWWWSAASPTSVPPNRTPSSATSHSVLPGETDARKDIQSLAPVKTESLQPGRNATPPVSKQIFSAEPQEQAETNQRQGDLMPDSASHPLHLDTPPAQTDSLPPAAAPSKKKKHIFW